MAFQAKNLTGVPSVFGDLNLAGQNMNQLSEQEALAKKKKLLAGGQSNDFQTATQQLFGNRMTQSGSYGV
jgi:ABC-type cobalamin transport system ATPase subunit